MIWMLSIGAFSAIREFLKVTDGWKQGQGARGAGIA
jgi:hypothetical protein